jgi:methyl-accepting chemotaxis protein
MVGTQITITPAFVRRRYPLKRFLVLMGVGVLLAAGVYASGRFGRPVVVGTAGGAGVTALVGTAMAARTRRSLDALAARAERCADGEEVTFETNRIDCVGRTASAVAGVGSALAEERAARADAEELYRHVERTAEEYSEVMRRCADGDLSVRMDPSDESAAMTEISVSFNEMADALEHAVGNVKRFADEVATHSQEMRLSTEEVSDVSDRVVDSIREVAADADEQTENLHSVTEEMNALSTTVAEVASTTDEVADIAERTAQTGEEGREAATEAIDGMNRIETESRDTVEAINQLESEVQQVDELIDFISEIAEQTNMLALNAHIEASRAGEQGEGFAAVANEIKELAEGAKEAAGDIESRLERIRSRTEGTVEEVRGTSDRIAEHTDAIENAASAFEEVAEHAQETNAGVQEITEATHQQAESTEEVLEMVEAAATVSEETSEESERMATTTQSQTMALSQVSASASDLAEQATRLSQALDSFETDSAVDADADELPPTDGVPADDVATDGDGGAVAGDSETVDSERAVETDGS